MPYIEKLKRSTGKLHIQQHHWVMLVVRYKYRSTLKSIGDVFTEASQSPKNKSGSPDIFDLFRDGEFATTEIADLKPLLSIVEGANGSTRGAKRARVTAAESNTERSDGVLTLTDDVTNWSVSSRRSAMIGTASFSLAPTRDWVRDIAGGDWVMFWAVDNTSDWNNLVAKLRDGKPCNDEADGLKFVGRVKNVKMVESILPNGTETTSYQVNAKSFSELEHELKYHPALGEIFALAGLPYLKEIFSKLPSQTDSLPHTPSAVFQTLLKVMFGQGFFANSQLLNGSIPATLNTSLPMLIPPTIQKYMGADTPSFGAILRHDNGVLDYADQYNAKTPQEPLAGETPVLGYDFNNRSMESILRDFLNPPINEMFVTLRRQTDGKIWPHLCIRQTPLSSTAMRAFGRPITPYMSLPRWDVTQIRERFEVETDYDMKFNFFHMPTRDLAMSSQAQDVNLTSQYNNCPPIADLASIQRDGIRAYERQLLGVYNSDSRSQQKTPNPAPAAKTTAADVPVGAAETLSQDMLGRKARMTSHFGEREIPVIKKWYEGKKNAFPSREKEAMQIAANFPEVHPESKGDDRVFLLDKIWGFITPSVSASDLVSGKKTTLPKENHPGVDFGAVVGTHVYAVRAGVARIKSKSTLALQVDNEWEVRMLHLSSIDVQEGAQITAGQQIAKTGDAGTGPHLHVEIYRSGVLANPLDVYHLIPGEAATAAAPAPASTDSPASGGSTAQQWGQLLASDFMLDQHLRGQGTVTTAFIQKPICIGDVCAIKDKIGMIEQVTHNGSLSADGRKSASTSLSLSNIVRVEPTDPSGYTYLVDDQDRPVPERASNAVVFKPK